jgi:hypothetical protein
MAQEIAANGLSGQQTLSNIVKRAESVGIEIRRDDVRFVLDVVSEPIRGSTRAPRRACSPRASATSWLRAAAVRVSTCRRRARSDRGLVCSPVAHGAMPPPRRKAATPARQPQQGMGGEPGQAAGGDRWWSSTTAVAGTPTSQATWHG